MEFNDTFKRKQDLNILYQYGVFLADRKNKMAASASDWLRQFLLLLWNCWTELNETWLNARSQCPLPRHKCVFFGPIGKSRWPPWPLIGWDIFHFSSETAEQNLRKPVRKQDLNVLYQVCVYQTDWKIKMTSMDSDWLRHFPLLLWNCWTEFNANLIGSKISTSSAKFVFLGPIGMAAIVSNN